MIATSIVVNCLNTSGIGLDNGSSLVNVGNFLVSVDLGVISEKFPDSVYKNCMNWRKLSDYQDKWMVSLRKFSAQ